MQNAASGELDVDVADRREAEPRQAEVVAHDACGEFAFHAQPGVEPVAQTSLDRAEVGAVGMDVSVSARVCSARAIASLLTVTAGAAPSVRAAPL